MGAAVAGREPDGSAQERLVAAAERLFAERGFNGVSVREIAAAAAVNAAGVAYYFRSKEGLLAEVYRRHCRPMNEERFRLLAAARERARPPGIAEVLAAFIRPALMLTGNGHAPVTRLRAVLSAENSDLLDQLVAENFDQSSSRFVEALAECLPHLSREDIYWRFHFLLGTVYYTASGPHRIRALSQGRCDPADAAAVIRELIPFLIGGLSAPSVRKPSAERRRRASSPRARARTA
jgi:AcrR family transcriptional regulator